MTGWGRRSCRALAWIGAGAVVLVASIVISVMVTPMRAVSVAGQTVLVGAVSSWHLSGLGELGLFGQRLSTTMRFAGPVRPSWS